jgi:hypothetical protein
VKGTVGAYTIRNDGIKLTDDGQKQVLTGYVRLQGRQAARHDVPGKSSFHSTKASRRARTWPFAARSPRTSSSAGRRTRHTDDEPEIHVNPLVDWIWMGFGVLAFGTGIAAPESTFAFALAKMPAEAATTTLTLLLSFGSSSAAARRRRRRLATPPPDLALRPRRPRPSCSTRSSAPAAATIAGPQGSVRHVAPAAREVAALIDEGRSHDEIIRAVIANLAKKCSARRSTRVQPAGLAVSVLASATGAVLIGLSAMKWTRRPEPAAAAAAHRRGDGRTSRR